ncbi:MAG: rhodanese-like domain-containing protein [Gammaproteobacteria bacterium]
MKTITVDALKKRIDQNNVLLIDVREPAEHRSEYIEGAFLIPLNEISLEKLPLKSSLIVMHCKSGKRSADACEKLLSQDPTLEVYSLEGGIIAWQQAGFEVKKKIRIK